MTGGVRPSIDIVAEEMTNAAKQEWPRQISEVQRVLGVVQKSREAAENLKFVSFPTGSSRKGDAYPPAGTLSGVDRVKYLKARFPTGEPRHI